MGGFAIPREDIQHALRLGKATAVAIVYSRREIDALYSDLDSFPLTTTDREWISGDPQRDTAFRLYCDEEMERLSHIPTE